MRNGTISVVAACWLAIIVPWFVGCASLPSGRDAVDRVEFEGTSQVSASDIEDKIATAPSPRFLGLWEGVVFDYELYDPYVLERDLARVERFYRARGFYEARARAGRVQRTKQGHVAITIVVEEGLPITVGDVRADGLTQLNIDDSNAALAAVRKKLKHGRAFDEDDFQAAETAFKRALTDRGYAYASVTGKANVDLSQHVADVTFTVNPGIATTLGPIIVEGLGGVPEAPVRRALDLSTGDPYSTAALDSAQRAALDLGVFSSVEVTPDLADPNARQVPIHVHVVPTELRSVRLGGGAELDVIRTDLHLLTGWEDRNFLGGLRHFSVDLRPGLVLYPTKLPTLQSPQHLLPEEKARAELRQPGFIEARTSGILRAELNAFPLILQNTQDETQSAIPGYLEVKGAAGVDRTFWKLYTNLSYNAQTERPFSYIGPNELDPLVLSYVDLITNLDFRNSPIHPHKGVFVGNDLQVAGLFGNAKDVRVQPDVRAYIPIARKVTFALRATTGFLFPKNYGTGENQLDVEIIYFRGFFSGGPNSNRGYPFHGIGPESHVPTATSPTGIAIPTLDKLFCVDPNDCHYPIGGRSLWEASAELRFPIVSALSGAAFCDASDVSDNELDVRLQYPHPSCGAGLRYDTPVGPIRFDIGYRLPGFSSAPGEIDPGKILGAPIAISFGIGEAF